MDGTGRNVAIDVLVRLKLGAFYDWSAPEPVHSVGPCGKDRFDRFELDVSSLREQITAALNARDDDEIRASLDKDINNSTSEWFSQLFDKEISALKMKEPIWFALGFGHPDHEADFNTGRRSVCFQCKK